jgi:signal transduction histidine kinase
LDGDVQALRPHRDDVLIAAAGLVGGLVLWSLGLHTQPRMRDQPLGAAWVVLVPLAAMAGLELLRRAAPATALALAVPVLVADQFTVGNLATIGMFTDVVYAAVLYGSPAVARRVPPAAVLLTVVATLALLAWLREPEALFLGVVVGLVTIAPAFTGAMMREHRDTAEAERLRARQTALLAEMDRAQAVVAERARMARELHDVVANHLSAIAVHSAAALAIDDAATTREALGVIRANSVEGLAEMRRLIGLLRDGSAGSDGDAPAATPTLRGLAALVDQARAPGAAGGLTFTLHDLRPEGRTLPAPVELAAYRIVQESLTNALKHAAPGPVTVRVAAEDGHLRVTVTSACAAAPGPRAPGSRAGLIGMRERVALLRGTFEAGPDGGDPPCWRVRAELPIDAGQGATA